MLMRFEHGALHVETGNHLQGDASPILESKATVGA